MSHHVRWKTPVRLDGDERLGRAGTVSMSKSPPAKGCCVVSVHADLDDKAPSWHQCGMPVFGYVDLETDDLPRFGVCFVCLMEVARTGSSVPIYNNDGKPPVVGFKT